MIRATLAQLTPLSDYCGIVVLAAVSQRTVDDMRQTSLDQLAVPAAGRARANLCRPTRPQTQGNAAGVAPASTKMYGKNSGYEGASLLADRNRWFRAEKRGSRRQAAAPAAFSSHRPLPRVPGRPGPPLCERPRFFAGIREAAVRPYPPLQNSAGVSPSAWPIAAPGFTTYSDTPTWLPELRLQL